MWLYSQTLISLNNIPIELLILNSARILASLLTSVESFCYPGDSFNLALISNAQVFRVFAVSFYCHDLKWNFLLFHKPVVLKIIGVKYCHIVGKKNNLQKTWNQVQKQPALQESVKVEVFDNRNV